MSQKEEAKTAPPEALNAAAAQQLDKLAALAKNLSAIAEGRVQELAMKNQWIITKSDKSQVTINFQKPTVGQWLELDGLSNKCIQVVNKYKNQIVANKNKPEAWGGIIAEGKAAITKALVATLVKQAEYYFGMAEDDFYTMPYRDMVELIHACKIREENGDPNA